MSLTFDPRGHAREAGALTLRPPGLTWESVAPCVRWMAPFADALRAEEPPQLKDFPKVKADDRHNIQTHVAYLELLVSTPPPPPRFPEPPGRFPEPPGRSLLRLRPHSRVFSAEKSSEASGRRPRLSPVSRRRSHPDSAQQHRETDQSLSRTAAGGAEGFFLAFLQRPQETSCCC